MTLSGARSQLDPTFVTDDIEVHATQTTDDYHVEFADVVHRETATREQVITKPRFGSMRSR
jgi:hypothetical protein